jgi:hypothetical protein
MVPVWSCGGWGDLDTPLRGYSISMKVFSRGAAASHAGRVAAAAVLTCWSSSRVSGVSRPTCPEVVDLDTPLRGYSISKKGRAFMLVE